ncbi:MAG: hypothetical protein NVS3B8_11870 [Chitinophagaceae bacterium]
MYIYNVTTKVNWDIQEAWVAWMKAQHIPDVMKTGCFTTFQFARLLEADDTEGPTYAVQYHAVKKEDYDHYITHHAPVLRKEALSRWGNRFVGFRSLLQVVN